MSRIVEGMPAETAYAGPVGPLRPEDHESARAVFNHWITTSTATFHEEPLSEQQFRAEVAEQPDPRLGCFGIRSGEGLAGYVVLAPFKARCAYRDTAEVSVYLSPDHVGCGLGRQAISFAEQHARAVGLHVLLAVICTENTASLRLFTSAGFVEAGRLRQVGRKFGRLLDVAYLQKTLD